jgi:probable F420-dependent oxidoreductase
MYRRPYDPIVALTAAAAVTERLTVGTAVCLVPQRDPIILAKQIACVDRLAAGGFVLGAGFGWNREEMENHGVNPDDRWTLMRESVAAMREIWREDEAEYHGTLVDFERSWCWPKPATPGGPPVFIGGAGGPRLIRHVAEYADGWMPNHWGPDVDEALAKVRNGAEELGRDPASIRLVIPARPTPEVVDALRERNAEIVLLPIPSATRDETLPVLDRYAPVAQELNGR